MSIKPVTAVCKDELNSPSSARHLRAESITLFTLILIFTFLALVIVNDNNDFRVKVVVRKVC